MTDAFDDFERQLTAALPQPGMRGGRHGGRRPVRRVVALCAVAVFGVGAVATAALTGDSTVVRPRSADVDLSARFAVFRRPATEQDQIRTRDGRTDPTVTGISRLVLVDRSARLYAQDAGDGRVCLLLQSEAIASHTCTAKDQAIAGDLPPSITMLDQSASTTYLLMPDGVTSVTTSDANGHQETVPISDNGVVLPRDADRATWRTADGAEHSLAHLVPATPAPLPDVPG